MATPLRLPRGQVAMGTEITAAGEYACTSTAQIKPAVTLEVSVRSRDLQGSVTGLWDKEGIMARMGFCWSLGEPHFIVHRIFLKKKKKRMRYKTSFIRSRA